MSIAVVVAVAVIVVVVVVDDVFVVVISVADVAVAAIICVVFVAIIFVVVVVIFIRILLFIIISLEPKSKEFSQVYSNLKGTESNAKNLTTNRTNLVEENHQRILTQYMMQSVAGDVDEILSLKRIEITEEKSPPEIQFRSSLPKRTRSALELFSLKKKSISEESLNDINASCRLCKATIHPDQSEHLFSGKAKAKGLVNNISMMCGIRVTETDKISKTICRKCDKLITKMMDYRKICKNVHLGLRNDSTKRNQKTSRCRLCGNNMKSRHNQGMFSETKNVNEFINRIIRMCGVDITEHEPSPKVASYEVCRACDKFVEKMWNFRKSSQATQWELRNMLVFVESNGRFSFTESLYTPIFVLMVLLHFKEPMSIY